MFTGAPLQLEPWGELSGQTGQGNGKALSRTAV